MSRRLMSARMTVSSLTSTCRTNDCARLGGVTTARTFGLIFVSDAAPRFELDAVMIARLSEEVVSQLVHALRRCLIDTLA